MTGYRPLAAHSLEKRPPTIAQDASFEGPLTHSTSEVAVVPASPAEPTPAAVAEAYRAELLEKREQVRGLERPKAWSYLRGLRDSGTLARIRPHSCQKVYDWVASHAVDWDGSWCVPPADTDGRAVMLDDIVRGTGLSKSTVIRCIARLEELRLLYVERLTTAWGRGTGGRDGARYWLLMPEASPQHWAQKREAAPKRSTRGASKAQQELPLPETCPQCGGEADAYCAAGGPCVDCRRKAVELSLGTTNPDQ